jgi:hypothetical protein
VLFLGDKITAAATPTDKKVTRRKKYELFSPSYFLLYFLLLLLLLLVLVILVLLVMFLFLFFFLLLLLLQDDVSTGGAMSPRGSRKETAPSDGPMMSPRGSSSKKVKRNSAFNETGPFLSPERDILHCFLSFFLLCHYSLPSLLAMKNYRSDCFFVAFLACRMQMVF